MFHLLLQSLLPEFGQILGNLYLFNFALAISASKGLGWGDNLIGWDNVISNISSKCILNGNMQSGPLDFVVSRFAVSSLLVVVGAWLWSESSLCCHTLCIPLLARICYIEKHYLINHLNFKHFAASHSPTLSLFSQQFECFEFCVLFYILIKI
jgi:hypothetical protein